MDIDFDNVESLTVDQILSEKAIDYIYSEEDLVRRAIVTSRFRRRAAALKVKADFDLLIKSAERQINDEKAEEMKKSTTPAAPGGNIAEVTLKDGDTIFPNTGKWIIDKTGVYANGAYGPIVACNYPIIVTRRFVDRETQKEEVEIAWKRDGMAHYYKTARSVIASNTKIVALSDYGVPVTSEISRNLVSFLSDYEKLNPNLIQVKMSTNKYGWVDDEFIPYSTAGGESGIEFNIPPSFNALRNSIREVGDPHLWMDVARKIRCSGRQEPLIYMAASFGSILVPIINISPFICNLYGESGKGKTVNLMLAASIWGEPKTYLTESTSTTNSIEQRLNILNNLPMMIDDLSKIRDRGDNDKFTELIYMICAGRGKGRLNKNVEMRETATWANITLTNIERPLAVDTMQGGAINRVLDFEIQPGNIFEDGNAVVTAISGSYGHAGQMFVDVVISHKKEIPDMVSKYEAEIKRIATSMDQEKEQKQITPLAMLLTADELAEKYIFQDDKRIDIGFAVSMLKDIENVSEMERAMQSLEDEIVINRQKFHVDDFDEYKGEIWGLTTDEWTAIIPSSLNNIAKKYNFNAKQFIRWCDNRGMLIKDAGRLTQKISIPALDKRIRCYVIKTPEDDILYKKPPTARKNDQTDNSQINMFEYADISDNDIPFD